MNIMFVFLQYREADLTMFIVTSVISCVRVFLARKFNFVLLFCKHSTDSHKNLK
jgi:hypothetical protein